MYFSMRCLCQCLSMLIKGDFLLCFSSGRLKCVSITISWLERAGFALQSVWLLPWGDKLDREVGDLKTAKGPVGPIKLFTSVRYNAELALKG